MAGQVVWVVKFITDSGQLHLCGIYSSADKAKIKILKMMDERNWVKWRPCLLQPENYTNKYNEYILMVPEELDTND